MFLCMLYCTLCYIYVVICFFFFLFIKLYPLKIPFGKVAKRIGYAIKLLGGFGHSIAQHITLSYAMHNLNPRISKDLFLHTQERNRRHDGFAGMRLDSVCTQQSTQWGKHDQNERNEW